MIWLETRKPSGERRQRIPLIRTWPVLIRGVRDASTGAKGLWNAPSNSPALTPLAVRRPSIRYSSARWSREMASAVSGSSPPASTPRQ